MTPTVDNNSLSRQGDIIFANSSGYHVELRMTGRETESGLLEAALTAGGSGRLVTIRAPLGAGKTFFLNTVLGGFARSNPGFDERQNCQFVLATGLDIDIEEDGSDIDVAMLDDDSVVGLADEYDSDFIDAAGLRVLIIEELDRKATFGQILWSVAAGLAWLAKGGDRLLILTGDATIANTRLQEFISHVKTHSHIELAPLDLPLLVDALEARIFDKLVAPTLEGEGGPAEISVARQAAEQLLSAESVRWAAVPVTDPNQLATFREALGALRQMAAIAPSSDGRVEFGPELLVAVGHAAAAPWGTAADLESALHGLVVRSIQSAEPLVPLTILELAALIDADVSSEKVLRRFRQRAVEAIARLGLITPLGVPYDTLNERGDEPIAICGPFLPSYRLVHRALAELHVQ